MISRAPTTSLPTHVVENQTPPLSDINLYERDVALAEALQREGAGFAETAVRGFGASVGRAETMALGDAANRFPPQLAAFDRYGARLDEVGYHPAYHALMKLGLGAGIHALPWQEERPGAHVAHAALEYLLTQAEAGVCCPITMTYASVPALQQEPALAAEWLPKILVRDYDERALPISDKRAATVGMAMTEKQGGSDVRATTTRAEPAEGDSYRLTGHKWFCSAPMSDGFLTLAQAPGGLTCFLVPRWRPDGTRNAIRLQRLKDKLGNRSNASAEIEYDGAHARRIAAEGRGIAAIMTMVRHTRLDSAVVCAGMMRQGVFAAAHHAGHRRAFGKRLVEQPAMTAVLADLALEAEAALVLVMRVARAFDGADEAESALARIGSALAKFWVTKRLPGHAYEALECFGGNGYVEEAPMARLYREAPVNAIWEGSGNVNALDVMRALGREPGALEAWRTEAQAGRGGSARFDRFLDDIDEILAHLDDTAVPARRLVEDMALALQASLLLRHAPPAVSDAFVAARIGGGMRGCYGALPGGLDLHSIVARIGSA